MSDEDYMREALEEAAAARNEGEAPVGAVVVMDGQVICRAHNQRESLRDPTAHAEILCLRKAAKLIGDWRLRDCALYVTLEPCPMCAGAMVMSQLGSCIFGAADPQRGCCGSVYDLPGDPKLQGRTGWQAGILQSECEDMIRDFFAQQRKRQPGIQP